MARTNTKTEDVTMDTKKTRKTVIDFIDEGNMDRYLEIIQAAAEVKKNTPKVKTEPTLEQKAASTAKRIAKLQQAYNEMLESMGLTPSDTPTNTDTPTTD